MPAGAPREIVTKTQGEVLRITDLPDVNEKMLAGGLEPLPPAAPQVADLFRTEMARRGKVIRQAA